MTTQAKSLFIDGTHTVFPELCNASTGSEFIYPWKNFSVQVWIKTSAYGVIASTQTRRSDSSGYSTAQPNYGYWSLTVNADSSLTFNVTYYKYVPQGGAGRESDSFPYYTFNCPLQSRTEVSNGSGSKFKINDDKWHRVEAVRDGYVQYLYVDGVLVACKSFADVFMSGPTPVITNSTNPQPAPMLSSDDPSKTSGALFVGWDYYLSGGNKANNHFNGQIDELRLWGAALSRTTLASWANMIPTTDTSPNLYSRWAFDSDSQSAPVDATGKCPLGMWYGGSPTFSDPGFLPPSPKYLRLSGSGSYAKFVDSSRFAFTGDFTVQAWICPDVGQNGPIVSHQNNNGGWTLLTEENGSLTLFLQSGSQTFSITSPPASLFDGNWHQITGVRAGSKLCLYIDGHPAGEHKYSTIPGITTSTGALYIGGTTYSGRYAGKSTRYCGTPTGGYDEVRLWSKALTREEISASMFHAVSATDTSLVGYWQFDQSNLNDSSSYHTGAQGSSGTSYVDAPFDMTPMGQPYLLAQSCMLQEYVDSGSTVHDTTTYRVSLSARDGHDGARATALTIWSDESVTLQLGSGSATISHGNPLKVKTNGQGQLVFSIRARVSDSSSSADDKLYCPGIYVRADFMSETEQIFISPDRQFHAKLAAIDGASLKSGINGGPALLGGNFSNDDASAIAGAINDIMTTASHHEVRASSNSNVNSFVVTSSAMARDVVALQTGRPTQPLYVSRKAPVLSANSASHQIRSNYVPIPVQVDRITTTGYRANVATQFDYQTRRFTPVTASEVQALTAKCASFVQLSASTSQANASRSLSSLWSSFVAGALNVVHSVVETVENAAHKLQATIVHIIDGMQQAFQYIVDKIEDAADYLKGMLASLGVVATQVINFCRSLFSWDQYRPAYDLSMTYMDQMYRGIQAGLSGANQLIDQKLMSWKAQVDSAIDTLLANPDLAGLTLQSGGGQALTQPPGDVQSGYLGSVLTSHMDSFSSTRPTGGTTPPGPTPPDLSDNPSLMSFLETLTDGRGLLALGLNELALGLKSLLDWVFDTTASLVDGAFSAFESLLQSVWNILNAELPHIPILTNLFKSQLRVAWTPCSLFSMMGAVAANLAYKAAKADVTASLGTTQLVAQVEQGDLIYNAMLRLYSRIPGFPTTTLVARCNETSKSNDGEDDPEQQALDILGYVASGIYTVTSITWGVAAVATDLNTYQSLVPTPLRDAEGNILEGQFKTPVSPLDGLRMASTFFANLSAFPIMIFTADFSDPLTGSELALWGVYALSMASDFLAWKLGFDAGSTGSKVFAFVSGVFGLAALAGAIVIIVFDSLDLANNGAGGAEIADVVLKSIQNILGSFTLISQFCFLVPPTTPVGAAINAAPILIDGVAYFGGALINTARLLEDIIEGLPEIIR